MYNPFSIMPVYPTLSDPLGDVRDTSPVRIRWLHKKKAGLKENEVMERIMGLFGLEELQSHCLSLYERIVTVPVTQRSAEAGNIDMFFTGNEGAGHELAALRYRELLISLEIIPRPSLIHYFSDDLASIATTEQTVENVLSRKFDGPPNESVCYLLSSSPAPRHYSLEINDSVTLLIHFISSCLCIREPIKTVIAKYSTKSEKRLDKKVAHPRILSTLSGSVSVYRLQKQRHGTSSFR